MQFPSIFVLFHYILLTKPSIFVRFGTPGFVFLHLRRCGAGFPFGKYSHPTQKSVIALRGVKWQEKSILQRLTC